MNYWRGEASPGRLVDSQGVADLLEVGTVPNGSTPEPVAEGSLWLASGPADASGSSNYLSAPAGTLDLATGQLSVYAWFVVPSLPDPNDGMSLIGIGDIEAGGNGDFASVMITNEGSGAVLYLVTNPGGVEPDDVSSTATTLDDGQNHLLRLVYNFNEAGGAKLYVDDVLMLEANGAEITTNAFYIGYVGGYITNEGIPTGGGIDAVQLSNDANAAYIGPGL